MLSGRIAVITGGASGIGLALAKQCVARGMHIVLLDVERPVLEAAAAELRSAPPTPFGAARVEAFACDVSDAASMSAVANEVLSRCGRVDLLVNNAGVGGALGPIWFTQPKDWDWVVGVNLHGVVNGIRAFLPAMLAQTKDNGRAGHVVNTASIAGLTAPPFLASYVATKHAVVGLSESLSIELSYLGPQIRVSVVCPGGVKTRIMKSERNRPAALKTEPQTPPALLAKMQQEFEKLMAEPMPADELAAKVVAGIERDDFYILSHPAHNKDVRTRLANVEKAAKAIEAAA